MVPDDPVGGIDGERYYHRLIYDLQLVLIGDHGLHLVGGLQVGHLILELLSMPLSPFSRS